MRKRVVYLPWALGVQGFLADWASHHPPEKTTAEVITHGHFDHIFERFSWPLPALDSLHSCLVQPLVAGTAHTNPLWQGQVRTISVPTSSLETSLRRFRQTQGMDK